MGLIGAKSPQEYARELFRFHQWRVGETKKVLSNVQDEDLRKQLPGSFSSLLALLNHMCWAEMVWHNRINGLPMPARIDLDRESLWREWELATQKWVDSLENSTEEDWEKTFTFTNSKGGRYENNLLEIVVHLMDHSTYHFGQVMDKVRGLGHQPTSTNYIHYLRAQ